MNNCHNRDVKQFSSELTLSTQHVLIPSGHFCFRQGVCNWLASFIDDVCRCNYSNETSCHLSQVSEFLCDTNSFQPIETIDSVCILILPIPIIWHALSEILHQPDGPDDVKKYLYHMLCIRSNVRQASCQTVHCPFTVAYRLPLWAQNSKLTG